VAGSGICDPLVPPIRSYRKLLSTDLLVAVGVFVARDWDGNWDRAVKICSNRGSYFSAVAC